MKTFSQMVKSKKVEFKKNLKGSERTTRKERKNKKIHESIHKNRKSQILIRKKTKPKGKGGRGRRQFEVK